MYEEPHMFGQDTAGLYPGYYPMQIGNVLDKGRYQVVRKLGWGSWASIWLAEEGNGDRMDYVAVKILNISGTAADAADKLLERRVGQALMSSPSTSARKHVAIPKRIFYEESIYGLHLCLVYEPCGLSVSDLRHIQPAERFPLQVVKSIARQALMALDFLHNTMGVVHSDVKLKNMLVRLQISNDDLRRYLLANPACIYPPQSVPDISPEPIITVQTQPLPLFDLNHISLDAREICLSDYGAAYFIKSGCPERPIMTPHSIRAPEQLLDQPSSTPADIWALGCVVMECLTGAILYEPEPSAGYSNETYLAGITRLLGPLPEGLRRVGSSARDYDESGRPHVRGRSLEDFFRECQWVQQEMNPQDVDATCRFLRRCLTIDPQLRATAPQLLEDEWFRS
ncbi:kinase-like domain-containing protein [Cubamyces menziesii]|nr:kinase-like domain-containing protein [Cubamyces menziesii]